MPPSASCELCLSGGEKRSGSHSLLTPPSTQQASPSPSSLFALREVMGEEEEEEEDMSPSPPGRRGLPGRRKLTRIINTQP